MGNREQTILMVSDDAALCADARREFESRITGLRLAAVSSLAAARRILEDATPAAILLDEASAAPAEGSLGAGLRLSAVVTSLAVYAPVLVMGAAERRSELSALIDAGVAEYLARDGRCLPEAVRLIQRRWQLAEKVTGNAPEPSATEEDFGEVLRHELNNPLTGILGNAELLLAEIRRKNDGKLPHGGQRRVETIAALAVRLRETVRRLSQEWEERQHSTVR